MHFVGSPRAGVSGPRKFYRKGSLKHFYNHQELKKVRDFWKLNVALVRFWCYRNGDGMERSFHFWSFTIAKGAN